MTDTIGFSTWKDRIAWAAVVGIVGGAATWGGWMTVSINNNARAIGDRPMRAEVDEIVATKAPWREYEQRVLATMDDLVADMKEMQRIRIEERKDLLNVIANNTKAITDLRVEIAKMQARIQP